jgi:alkyl hydroperoxide reductase subunit AhpC
MATLWVNSAEVQTPGAALKAGAAPNVVACEAGPLLRDWLHGDWAMLFSHPVDFQYQGLEIDRWLSILRDEFRSRGVRPLACRRGAVELDSSWVSDLIADRGLVRVDSASAVGADETIDAPARALRDELLAMPPRFVVIVDDDLRRRGVLKYSAGRASVSPLDLLASIDVLRRRTAARIAA